MQVKSRSALFKLNGQIFDAQGKLVVQIPGDKEPAVVDLTPFVAEIKKSIAIAGGERDAKIADLLKSIEDIISCQKPITVLEPAPKPPVRRWRFKLVRDVEGKLKEIVAEPTD